jgi:hypothetical protein
MNAPYILYVMARTNSLVTEQHSNALSRAFRVGKRILNYWLTRNINRVPFFIKAAERTPPSNQRAGAIQPPTMGGVARQFLCREADASRSPIAQWHRHEYLRSRSAGSQRFAHRTPTQDRSPQAGSPERICPLGADDWPHWGGLSASRQRQSMSLPGRFCCKSQLRKATNGDSVVLT